MSHRVCLLEEQLVSSGAFPEVLCVPSWRKGGRKEGRPGVFVLFVLTPTELRKTQRGSEINLQLDLQLGRELLTKKPVI